MKTIFITKYIKVQETLINPNIKIINGRTPLCERLKIYKGFVNGEYDKISITESIVVSGGVNYGINSNNEIQIVFMDNIDDNQKNYILSRMNINRSQNITTIQTSNNIQKCVCDSLPTDKQIETKAEEYMTEIQSNAYAYDRNSGWQYSDVITAFKEGVKWTKSQLIK